MILKDCLTRLITEYDYIDNLEQVSGNQDIKTIEELSKLQEEVCKYMNGSLNRKDIIDKVSEALISIDVFCIRHDIDTTDIYDMMEKKLKKFNNSIKGAM